MTSLAFYVHGLPAAQGSKRHVGNGVMVESSKRVKPWRQDVTAAATQAMTAVGHKTFTGPVSVHVTFFLPRPKSHYRTGARSGELKPTAPSFHASRPDSDKLCRSTLDALGIAGAYLDDSQVASLLAVKAYSATPGAQIEIRKLP